MQSSRILTSAGVFCLLIACAAATLAQTPTRTPPVEEDEVIRVDTELVDVPLQVTDAAGKPVGGLRASNFRVLEDGVEQKVEEFTSSSAPMEVVLLLDTSGSTRSDLLLIRRSAQQFINSLRPGDRVAVIAFRSAVVDGAGVSEPEIVTGLTGDRRALSDALEQVGTSNGTPYYDGLIRIAEKIFADEPDSEFRGRRAMVALTDGVDSVSISGFDEAKELLGETGVAMYFINVDTRPFFEENLLGDCTVAIRFSHAQIRRYYGGFGKGSNVERTTDFCQLGDFERLAISKRLYEIAEAEMAELAKLSGGRVFPAASLQDARGAFRRVAEDIGTTYRIGYYSTNEARDGKFRRITVETRNLPAGTVVRAREGYTARP